MQNKQQSVQSFINQQAFDNFIKCSQKNGQQLQDLEINVDQKHQNVKLHQSDEQKHKNSQPNSQQIEQKKQTIIEKVNNMTIDQITFDLLKQNRLSLSAEEKKYKKQQQKLFLIRRGAAIEKQEYMNFKALKQLRKEQRLQAVKNNEILREDGMIGIKKDGKTYALQDRITYNDRDLVVKKIAPQFTESMRRFSDHSGKKIRDELADGLFVSHGWANVKQLAKAIRGSQRSKK